MSDVLSTARAARLLTGLGTGSAAETPGDRTDPVLLELLHHMPAPDPAARPGAREVAVRPEPLVERLQHRLVLGRRGTRYQ